MSKKAAKAFSKTSAKGGIAAGKSLKRGRGPHQISKIIEPVMDWREKLSITERGTLGPLPGGQEEQALRAFFEAEVKLGGYLKRKAHREGRVLEDILYSIDVGESLRAVLLEATACVSEMMLSAVRNRDASFFKRLAELLPSVAAGPISPVDYLLVNLQAWMEMIPKTPEQIWSKSGYMMMFPVWPASVPELHQWVRSNGIACDQSTIRQAAQRIGLPVRKAKRGAPKRKPAK